MLALSYNNVLQTSTEHLSGTRCQHYSPSKTHKSLAISLLGEEDFAPRCTWLAEQMAPKKYKVKVGQAALLGNGGG